MNFTKFTQILLSFLWDPLSSTLRKHTANSKQLLFLEIGPNDYQRTQVCDFLHPARM